MRIRIFILLISAYVSCMAAPCFAQEFRIYTKVYDESPMLARSGGDRRVVARPLTLFHAGRVYDYIHKAGEVIIFEPMQDRFTILNTKRQLKTIVHVDEIKHLIQTARRVTEQRRKSLEEDGGSAANSTARMLAFQLDPNFQKHFDRDKRELTLINPHLRYDVKLEFVEKAYSTAYRRYADWIHQLNFVLHPRILLPGPRMALNRELAAKQALPSVVSLKINTDPRRQLRAEHKIHWSLNRKDRAMIQQWNALLKRKSTRQITLREYQRQLGRGGD